MHLQPATNTTNEKAVNYSYELFRILSVYLLENLVGMCAKLVGFSLTFSLFISFGSRQDNRYRRLDSIFNAWYSSGKFSVNVLSAERGKPIYQKSLGLADEDSSRHLNDSTVFLLASISCRNWPEPLLGGEPNGRLNEKGKIIFFDKRTIQQFLCLLQLLRYSSR